MSAPRRVVNTHDADGKPAILVDEIATNTQTPTERIKSTLLWATAASPAPFDNNEDAGQWKLGTAPPANGSRFFHFELAPGDTVPTHEHQTDAIDYLVCTQGTITSVGGDTRVQIHKGDALIVHGTLHARVNEGDEPAMRFAVLLDESQKRAASFSGATNAK
jgi:quercetin dioxygenase-like cupin family protein